MVDNVGLYEEIAVLHVGRDDKTVYVERTKTGDWSCRRSCLETNYTAKNKIKTKQDWEENCDAGAGINCKLPNLWETGKRIVMLVQELIVSCRICEDKKISQCFYEIKELERRYKNLREMRDASRDGMYDGRRTRWWTAKHTLAYVSVRITSVTGNTFKTLHDDGGLYPYHIQNVQQCINFYQEITSAGFRSVVGYCLVGYVHVLLYIIIV
jgi:hypothetical protein